MKEQSSPAFKRALAEYERIASLHGEDSEQAINAFMKCYDLAPQHYRDEAGKMVEQMGMIPKPSGYTDNGQPVFSASDLAKHFGVSESEVIERLNQLDPQHKAYITAILTAYSEPSYEPV